jgi:hypothetical protein
VHGVVRLSFRSNATIRAWHACARSRHHTCKLAWLWCFGDATHLMVASIYCWVYICMYATKRTYDRLVDLLFDSHSGTVHIFCIGFFFPSTRRLFYATLFKKWSGMDRLIWLTYLFLKQSTSWQWIRMALHLLSCMSVIKKADEISMSANTSVYKYWQALVLFKFAIVYTYVHQSFLWTI